MIYIFLQRSIRPQVVTTFELPGCLDMWTVCGPQVKDPEDADEAKEDDEEVVTFIYCPVYLQVELAK